MRYGGLDLPRVREQEIILCPAEAFCPKAIEDQSLCVNGDIGDVLNGICF